MSCLLKTLVIIHLLFVYVECKIPALTVNKLNRELIARKRKDTVELCRMFNVENAKVESLGHSKHARSKRSAPTLDNLEAERRVENIIDKLYDEEQENGEKVTYRQKILPKVATTAKSVVGRRFDFAPAFLEGPGPQDALHKKMRDGEAKIPWHKKWNHGIVPYFIDPKTYDSFLAEKITEAFDYFEQNTCIRLQRLRERPTDQLSLNKVEWLYITNPSGTKQCVHSNEYKANVGVQLVVFGYDCMSQGEIVHEVMHILGFSHEHIREDRDHHISVLWDNIKPGYKKYFEIKKGFLSLPYDYASVLHYPARAFSKNGKYTLMASPGVKFGQRDGLSEIDVEKVSMIFGNECMNRNKNYLLTTCPLVVNTDHEPKNVSQEAIDDYFQDRLWPFAIVNYRIKDKIEFSIEERENIDTVIQHIEKLTCIEFRNMPAEEPTPPPPPPPPSDEENDQQDKTDKDNEIDDSNKDPDQNQDENSIRGSNRNLKNKYARTGVKKAIVTIADNTRRGAQNGSKNASAPDDESSRKEKFRVKLNQMIQGGAPKSIRRLRRSAPPLSPSRRDAQDVLVLTRSPEPGCHCPEPGHAIAQKELVINADCFNSVNDLLHLFVHVLGLDHQHNMHDRDQFVHVNFTVASKELIEEMEKKLPEAASVGFSYDYQSVMHYPWLHIKNGVTSVMYPIWNDGWGMGHWQGLSTVDAQKLNRIYNRECAARKDHIERKMQRKTH